MGEFCRLAELEDSFGDKPSSNFLPSLHHMVFSFEYPLFRFKES